jgi:type II secretory pathway predicted ATPase ExeA
MGKTLLARRILDGLEEEVFEATLLVMLPGAADAMGIFQRFARQLGAEEPARDRAGVLGQIYEQLAIVREDGRHAVLIVDDAQVMSPQVFAELGGLLSLEYEDRRLMSMLFVGSPELDRQIQNDASLFPRVDVRVRIQPLDLRASVAYVSHRLRVAHARPDLIPPATMEALHKLGRGRPRLLNTLADNALFEAYLAGRSAIEPGDVERAAADLGLENQPAAAFPARAAGASAAARDELDLGAELELTEAVPANGWPDQRASELALEVLGDVLAPERLPQSHARSTDAIGPEQSAPLRKLGPSPLDEAEPILESMFVELLEE